MRLALIVLVSAILVFSPIAALDADAYCDDLDRCIARAKSFHARLRAACLRQFLRDGNSGRYWSCIGGAQQWYESEVQDCCNDASLFCRWLEGEC